MKIDSERRSPKVSLLAAAIGAASIGVLFYNVMPLYLGSMQDGIGFNNSQIGLVASAFFLGFNAISASSYFWVRRVPIRLYAMISAILLAMFLLLGAYFSKYALVLSMSVFIGGTSGALASMAATIISDARNSTIWFGIKTATESAAGFLLLSVLPATLIPAFGFKGTVFGMLAYIMAVLPLFIFLIRGRLDADLAETPHLNAENSEKRSSMSVWLALSAMLVVFLGGSAIWAFEERIANQYGFDPEWVGMVLGFSLIFAVIGPITSGVAGQKFGNRGPFAVAASLMIVGVYAIALSNQNATYYAVGACAFMLGWGSSVTHLFARVAISNPNGRYIALSIPALGIGSMIGPALAGFLYSGGSLTPPPSSVSWRNHVFHHPYMDVRQRSLGDRQ